MRSISLEHKGIRTYILTEVILFILIGLIHGLVCGSFLTWMMSVIDPEAQIVVNFIPFLLVSFMMIALAIFTFSIQARSISKKTLVVEFQREHK
ncbi:FtsX-like permease family protein [Alkalihalobacillus pseudalcaliphilus]|uniref:FtsX-like permease family protein n=1 Tax=Alkalihalobacillus pseudalcaliphilus TaxID=79884 RepID=UPI003B5AF78C